MSALVTIITPCFNSEKTLETTLQSVLNQDFADWEVIIVNDGSVDSTEEIALKWVNKDSRFSYYFKENEGLGKARNYGIAKTSGKYILPLDSDNQLAEDFLSTAIEVLKNRTDVDVVHGYAEYFGEREGLWVVDDFNLQKLLFHNYIDACAIYKKELWEKVGGYDEHMPHQGHEDWDFWVSVSSIGAVFYNLHQVTFKYYVSGKSMIHSFTNNMVLINQDYIVKKHSKLYHAVYTETLTQYTETLIQYTEALTQIEDEKKAHIEKLKSRKYILHYFCKSFFGLTIFEKWRDPNDN